MNQKSSFQPISQELPLFELNLTKYQKNRALCDAHDFSGIQEDPTKRIHRIL